MIRLQQVAVMLLGTGVVAGLGGPLVAQPVSRQVSPPPSAGHALVYHDSMRAVLLVNAGLGGMDTPAADTPTTLWRWDGSQWHVVSADGPSIRNLGGVAYDVGRNVLVLFGGSFSLDRMYGDTWEWAPASGWTRRDVPGPGVRDHVDMAYDRRSGRVVLHGGQASLTEFPATTWTWDGTTWREHAASGVGSRIHHTMAYDLAGDRLLMFGGRDPTTRVVSGDTWAWDGSAWRPAAEMTRARSHARIAAGSRGPILFGGFPEEAGGMQWLSPAGWRSVTGVAPSPRHLTAMAYDPVRRVTVLFGGGTADGLLGDTWEYSDGIGWRRAP